MLHLLQLEWKKQKNYVLFKVLVLAYLLLLPGALMTGKKLNLPEEAPIRPQTMFFEFPTVWGWLGYNGNWLVFFVFGFLAVLMITNEYSYRTLPQKMITGMHRSSFFVSKLYFMLAICLGATLYYSLCSVVIGLAHADTIYFSTVFKNWDMMPRYFLMSLGYMSFGLMVAVLIRRTGIALFVYLAYTMFLEPVFRWAVHLRLWKHPSVNYYPLNSFEDLCPVPFSPQADWFLKEHNFQLWLSPTLAVILSIGYIGLFLSLSLWRLERSDL